MKKRFVLLLTERGSRWYWNLYSPDKEHQARGMKSYDSKANLLRSLKKLKAFDFEYILVREVVEVVDFSL